jgi:hypothetical protein
MKLLLAFAIGYLIALLSGCTASLHYNDPESGISAALTHDFDGKTMKRLRGYAK